MTRQEDLPEATSAEGFNINEFLDVPLEVKSIYEM